MDQERPLIDARELQALVELCTEYGVFADRPDLQLRMAAFDPASKAPFDHLLYEAWKADVLPFRQFHEKYPFIVATDEKINGPIILGRQLANNSSIGIDASEFARHVLITGSTGTGKTTFTHAIAEQAFQAGLQAFMLGPKDDERYLAVRYPKMLVLHADAKVNLLRQPSFLSRSEHIATITDRLVKAMYSGQTGKAVLHEALTLTYNHTDDPTLRDLLTTLDQLPKKGDTYQRVDAIRSILMRIRRLIDRYPGLAMRDAIGVEDLCDRSLLIPVLSYGDAEDFLFSYLTTMLFHHHRTKGIRDLRTVIIVDEGLLALNADDHHISGNPIAELHGMTREFGIAWIVSVNTATLANEQLRNNSYVHIAMNCNSNEDTALVSKTFGLTKEQTAYLQHDLTRGQCIIRLGDRWRHPILATFSERTNNKHVSATDWEGACERINNLHPSRETMVSQPATLSPSPAPPVAPPVLQPVIASNALLNRNQHAFLAYIAERGIALVTETYDALGFQPMQGDRIKKRLLALDLVTQTRISVGIGRGKEAIALTATEIAYNILDIKRPRIGKGGPQHAWILRTLHERLPGSAIEVNGADIAIAYNTTNHAALLAFLRTTRQEISLNTGDTIAIEVDQTTKTIARNIERDEHYTITIIAVRQETLASARRFTKGNVIVVEIFDLLKGLEAA